MARGGSSENYSSHRHPWCLIFRFKLNNTNQKKNVAVYSAVNRLVGRYCYLTKTCLLLIQTTRRNEDLKSCFSMDQINSTPQRGLLPRKKISIGRLGKKNPKSKQNLWTNKQTNKTLNRQGVPNYLDYSMAWKTRPIWSVGKYCLQTNHLLCHHVSIQISCIEIFKVMLVVTIKCCLCGDSTQVL